MQLDEVESLDGKIKKSVKTFEGIVETFGSVITPPPDLRPEKRGLCVCLGIGTVGLLCLNHLNAVWYADVTEAAMTVAIAILILCKVAK